MGGKAHASMPSVWNGKPLVPAVPPRMQMPVALPVLFTLGLRKGGSPSRTRCLLVDGAFNPADITSKVMPVLISPQHVIEQ